jgi:hypothetical protein
MLHVMMFCLRYSLLGCNYNLAVTYYTGVAAYTAAAHSAFTSGVLKAVAAVTTTATLLLLNNF